MSTHEEEERNQIFSKLQQVNQQILSSFSDFRGYCNLFFDSTKDEIERFFIKDIEVKKVYYEM